MENLIDILKQLKWLSIGLIIPIWKFVHYLKDRKESKTEKKTRHLKSIQPFFKRGSSGSTANGSEWTLNFVNKGEIAKNIELKDPTGGFSKINMTREVKTDAAIFLEGKSPNKIQHANNIPAYQATLIYQDLEGSTYHQSIIRKQGSKSFYIEIPILKK